MPEFVKLADLDRLPPGSAVEVEHEGRIYALFHRPDGAIYVLDGICPHQGGPLAAGVVQGTIVRCPWHGWQFDLRTGRSESPHRLQQSVYEVKIDGRDVLVSIP